MQRELIALRLCKLQPGKIGCRALELVEQFAGDVVEGDASPCVFGFRGSSVTESQACSAYEPLLQPVPEDDTRRRESEVLELSVCRRRESERALVMPLARHRHRKPDELESGLTQEFASTGMLESAAITALRLGMVVADQGAIGQEVVPPLRGETCVMVGRLEWSKATQEILSHRLHPLDVARRQENQAQPC